MWALRLVPGVKSDKEGLLAMVKQRLLSCLKEERKCDSQLRVDDILSRLDLQVITHRVDAALTLVYFLGELSFSSEQLTQLPATWDWMTEAGEISHLSRLKKEGKRAALSTWAVLKFGAASSQWPKCMDFLPLPGEVVRFRVGKVFSGPGLSPERHSSQPAQLDGWSNPVSRKYRNPGNLTDSSVKEREVLQTTKEATYPRGGGFSVLANDTMNAEELVTMAQTGLPPGAPDTDRSKDRPDIQGKANGEINKAIATKFLHEQALLAGQGLKKKPKKKKQKRGAVPTRSGPDGHFLLPSARNERSLGPQSSHLQLAELQARVVGPPGLGGHQGLCNA